MLLAAVSGCEGERPDSDAPAPATTRARAASASTSAPLPAGLATPPSTRPLTAKEQSAVDDAAETLSDAASVAERLLADPASAVADVEGLRDLLVRTYYSASYAETLLDTLKALANRDQRFEGTSVVRWVVPVLVDLNAPAPFITLEACTTSEGLRVVGDEIDAPTIFPTSIQQTTLVDGGSNGSPAWQIVHSERLDDC